MDSATLMPERESAAHERQHAAAERVRIDESTRVPVLVFFASALVWLMLGSTFALGASIKMHSPHFLADAAWLTFGRLRMAHLNAVIYGWAFLAGYGVLLWLMARLSRSEVRLPWLLVVSAAVWNLGVAVGIVGILAGRGTSIEWLEFPPEAPPILVAGYVLFAVWAVVTFRQRREQHVYVTQWYLFGGLFWMPWLYTAATALLVYYPVSGVTSASINWWFAHNILGLWFTPIGVGAAYYLIPKVIGRPIHSYYLSILGFWTLAIFYNWAGTHHLVGGPVPAWLVTVGIVGSLMMFIPVVTVGLNHHFTMLGHFRKLRSSPTLRFVVFGAMSYTAVSVQGSLQSLRTVQETTHFTHYTIAHAHLGVYAFYSMVMFGSMYYIVPRLTGWEWASANLIRLHFWLSAGGVLLYWGALTWAGWYQGRMLLNAEVPFLQIVQYTKPYLVARSVAGLMMSGGHVAFAVLFVMNVAKVGSHRLGPTLLNWRAEQVEQGAELQPAEA